MGEKETEKNAKHLLNAELTHSLVWVTTTIVLCFRVNQVKLKTSESRLFIQLKVKSSANFPDICFLQTKHHSKQNHANIRIFSTTNWHQTQQGLINSVTDVIPHG